MKNHNKTGSKAKPVLRRKNGRQAIAFILNNLGTIFEGDRTARSECATVINDVQKAEMTPGEIAASKKAWDKVLKPMKTRYGQQTHKVNMRSEGHKRRKDNRKGRGKNANGP